MPRVTQSPIFKASMPTSICTCSIISKEYAPFTRRGTGYNTAITYYDFGIPLMPRFANLFPDQCDKDISLFIMEMYTNFAKLGNPTPQPVSDVTFERYNSSQRAYLRVDKKSEMKASFAPRRMSFWNDYYPKLMEVKFKKRQW